MAGKTVFITGASRGIGKAIALRCARDGANVIIAAKTAEPHPKLPGTIYTAAKESMTWLIHSIFLLQIKNFFKKFSIVEQAGGNCLPCMVDIRFEDQVAKAIDDGVKQFGGIDILVNNASAISL